MTAPLPPPGWYPDPDGTEGQRYWDGSRWTESKAGKTAPAPPGGPPFQRRKVPRWVVGAVVLVIIIIFASHRSHGGNSSTATPTSSTYTPTTTTYTPTTTTYTPTTTTYSESEIERTVIDTCEESVKKQLKDPDSAKFSDWKAWIVTHYDTPPPGLTFHPENGDKLYSAGGSVNAKNGFGGYVGDQPYGCDASATTSGDIHAHAYSFEDILNNPSATP